MERTKNPLQIISPDKTDDNCGICLELPQFPKIITKNCSHIFCEECAMKWFESNSSTCPICRKDTSYVNKLTKDGKYEEIYIPFREFEPKKQPEQPQPQQ